MSKIIFIKDYEIVLEVEKTNEIAMMDCSERSALAGDTDFDFVLLEVHPKPANQNQSNQYMAHRKMWDGIWYTMSTDFRITAADDVKWRTHKMTTQINEAKKKLSEMVKPAGAERVTAEEMTKASWFNSEEYVKHMQLLENTVTLEERKRLYPMIKWTDDNNN